MCYFYIITIINPNIIFYVFLCMDNHEHEAVFNIIWIRVWAYVQVWVETRVGVLVEFEVELML